MYRSKDKAVSPIVANVLMVATVVAVGTMLAVWAVTTFGLLGGGMGSFLAIRAEAVQEKLAIEHVQLVPPNNVTLYVRNVGTVELRVAAVYVTNLNNQTQAAAIELTPSLKVKPGELVRISKLLPAGWVWTAGDPYIIKVSTVRGNWDQVVKVP